MAVSPQESGPTESHSPRRLTSAFRWPLLPRTRLGLGISRDAVRAVAVRGSAIDWAVERPVRPGETLGAAIAALLDDAPLPAWSRTAVVVALGPSLAQTRHLVNLPPVSDGRLLDALVRENAGRFFLRNGVPLATSGVEPDGRDGAWAAACEAPVLADVERACRERRLRLVRVLPAVATFGTLAPNESVRWRDGDSVVAIAFAGGRIKAVRRVSAVCGASESALTTSAGGETACPSPLADAAGAGPHRVALASLGGDAWRFADACGAALSQGRVPLSWVVNGPRGGSGSGLRDAVPRWRGRLALLTLSVSIAAALAAPGLAAVRAERSARQHLGALASRRTTALRDAAQLGQVSAALADFAAFAAARRSPTELLAALARALPAGAAAVAVRTDSSGGTIVVLAPSAAAVLARVDGIPGVASPEIVGPVTREVAGTREVER